MARACLGVLIQEIKGHDPSVVQIGFDWIKADWRIAKCKNAVLNKKEVKCSVHGISVLPYVGAWSSIIKKISLFGMNISLSSIFIMAKTYCL